MSDGVRAAGSRGIRNTEPLIDAQKNEIMRAVDDLRLNPSDVVISRSPSVYLETFDIINIGPNSFPAAGVQATGSVFERLTPRAVVAHEAGHMLTTRAGTSFPAGSVLDEFQASVVGRDLPGLNSTERFQLLRDAVERARAAGAKPRELLFQMKHPRS